MKGRRKDQEVKFFLLPDGFPRSDPAAGLTGPANPLTIEWNALCPKTTLRGSLFLPRIDFWRSDGADMAKPARENLAGTGAEAFWKADL
jgi:hypothetical protein